MKLFLKGVVIGIGKIIPGISGGFLAIMLNVYEEALNRMVNPFKKDNFWFLFLLGSGILLSILAGSNIIIYLLNNYYLPIMLLFIGMIIGGLYELNNKIDSFKISFFTIGLISLFLTYFGQNRITDITFIGLFLVGIVEAVTIVVPGVSGTAFLMILGYYYPLMNAISEISLLYNIVNNLYILWPFTIGLIVGIYTFTYIMSYLIKRYHDNVYSFILGISISSILLLFLETFTYNYSLLQIIISIFLLVTGYIISKKCI